jgi:hypothetical protein
MYNSSKNFFWGGENMSIFAVHLKSAGSECKVKDLILKMMGVKDFRLIKNVYALEGFKVHSKRDKITRRLEAKFPSYIFIEVDEAILDSQDGQNDGKYYGILPQITSFIKTYIPSNYINRVIPHSLQESEFREYFSIMEPEMEVEVPVVPEKEFKEIVEYLQSTKDEKYWIQRFITLQKIDGQALKKKYLELKQKTVSSLIRKKVKIIDEQYDSIKFSFSFDIWNKAYKKMKDHLGSLFWNSVLDKSSSPPRTELKHLAKMISQPSWILSLFQTYEEDVRCLT